jgi:hypothetical protein
VSSVTKGSFVIARATLARFVTTFALAIAAGSPLSRELSAQALLAASTVPDPRVDSVTGEVSQPEAAPLNEARQEVWRTVVSELHRRGASERQLPRADDLDLPMALPALAGARLRIASACWDEGPRRTQFRIECGAPGQCPAFLVYMRMVHMSKDMHDDRSDTVRDSGNRAPESMFESCRLPAATGARAESSAKPDVRPGDRAVALFLAKQMRMTASVTCLDRGREGEVVRVRAADGHIFRARVSGPDRLEALPQ